MHYLFRVGFEWRKEHRTDEIKNRQKYHFRRHYLQRNEHDSANNVGTSALFNWKEKNHLEFVIFDQR